MIPDNQLSAVFTDLRFNPPDGRYRISKKVDYELGPISLSNTSEGLAYQIWKIWVNGDDIIVSPEADTLNQTILFSETGITEVSLAFDQLAKPLVSYLVGGVCKLWWFNPLTSLIENRIFGPYVTPLLTMDDKRPLFSSSSDVIFVYIRDGAIYFRIQRDRFDIEYMAAVLPVGTSALRKLGMTTINRLAVALV